MRELEGSGERGGGQQLRRVEGRSEGGWRAAVKEWRAEVREGGGQEVREGGRAHGRVVVWGGRRAAAAAAGAGAALAEPRQSGPELLG